MTKSPKKNPIEVFRSGQPGERITKQTDSKTPGPGEYIRHREFSVPKTKKQRKTK